MLFKKGGSLSYHGHERNIAYGIVLLMLCNISSKFVINIMLLKVRTYQVIYLLYSASSTYNTVNV